MMMMMMLFSVLLLCVLFVCLLRNSLLWKKKLLEAAAPATTADIYWRSNASAVCSVCLYGQKSLLLHQTDFHATTKNSYIHFRLCCFIAFGVNAECLYFTTVFCVYNVIGGCVWCEFSTVEKNSWSPINSLFVHCVTQRSRLAKRLRGPCPDRKYAAGVC